MKSPQSTDEDDFHKRTRFLVDRGFQSRYFATWLTISFWVAFAMSFFYIIGTWLYLRYNQDPSGWTAEEYRRAVRLFVAGNIVFILFLIVLIGVSALMHSHRIAGACFRIKKDLQRFRDGEHTVEISLREKDFLHDLAEEVNETFRQVRARYRQQERQLELAKDLAESLREADLPENLAVMVEEVSRRIRVKAELPLEPIEVEPEDEDDPEERSS